MEGASIMLEWVKQKVFPYTNKCIIPFGSLVISKNVSKKKRIDTGHKNKTKRYKHKHGKIINYPTKNDGYKDTAGYKYIGICAIMNNRKEFL